DDALLPPSPDATEYRTDRQSAKIWLSDTLSAGRRASSDILADGREFGFSEKTLRRAFKELCGTPQKDGMSGGWFWSLTAEDGQLAPEDAEGARTF
ncbi:MAG: hypothetical protein KDJ29_21660, partial [Hyphomicrobiales bacterium]|nr:hypothetical protein [Hyphomicrobiales bacterium]